MSPTIQMTNTHLIKTYKPRFFAVNVPLSVRFNFGESKRFYIQGGFSIDLNLFAGGRGLYSSHGPTSNYPTILDKPTDSIPLSTKVSFTPRLGIGYKAIVKKRNFAIQLDYLINATPVIEGEMEGKFQSQYLRLNLIMSSKR